MLFFLFLLVSSVYSSQPVPESNWGCPVSANTTLVQSIADSVHVYSASFIHGELAETWPAFSTRAGRRFRGFRYCYESEETKDFVTCHSDFWNALVMWAKALGPPGEQSSHSFAWQEANNGEMEPGRFQTYFCYNDLSQVVLGFLWNDKVPDDTLVIRVAKDSSESRATVGYKGVNQGRHPHELTIGGSTSTAVIAHEIGHVMGMVHEHNRNDRDKYVRFSCHNVNGFDDALGRAISNRIPPAEAQKRLCEDRNIALEYNFNSPAFLKNEILSGDPAKWGALDEPGGYDIDSLMHYSSYAFGDIGSCFESPDYCTLVELRRDAQGNEIGTRRIPTPVEPSKGDVAWVKRNYCWPADADCRLW